CLMLLQYPDNLLVCETVALHSLVLSMGQSLLQNGLVQRGKVRGIVKRYDEGRVGATEAKKRKNPAAFKATGLM
ncbi:hypothetical protein, partial [Allorhizobium ampelinum]|uniref:hypothetical protein n=1 Tax=Allorhizobium ampelinum TaxID=3025782 RepID=UPI001F2277F0